VTNRELYDAAFRDALGVSSSDLVDSLEYQSVQSWDSVGHMGLIAALEDAFGISMEMDDIIDFSSYKKGFELLAKYQIQF
jgi:acyl carrier protein